MSDDQAQQGPDLDRVAVALLRTLRPDVQTAFLNSPEFRGLPAAERERLYVIDAEMDATRRTR
ncbi:hypothetical protein DMB42_52035 [Nonomuraea sp. WAC 01424]|uniref:hypothetical protein n=1 Tax=Nonomuraea sp. WAC 01424 TaxID=2203200 RepID=UPI000F76E3ED|nr:hypothetical protein [Nonomuraea sp. WAC 01424]RSM93764.1 hypothetical protein DMB42_52035 [Nonomuraea sp. WAC 01424]